MPELSADVFEYIFDYVKELEDGKKTIYTSITTNNGLVLFAENFLAQLSAYHLDHPIDGLNESAGQDLRRLRRELEGSGGSVALQRLLFHLEPLCSRVPEFVYSHSESDSWAFHAEYMPEFLELIAEWATEHWQADDDDDDEVVEEDHPVVVAAQDAAFRYREAVE